ncbi:MAG: hypothetical protein R3293_06940 [Candidatus Promineifilaceae bacterium]|nr:hypothetical protein [Candidatus Promineifilaceae bacterium]
MKRKYTQTILLLGYTAIFIGYLTVWLPGPGAGLSFLGIEMGEWFKFLGLGARRDIFYLPPITLGLMLAIWTMTWPNNNWQAWTMRGLALLVSFLAFPAFEDITGPVREQYILRVLGIILVAIIAILSGMWRLSQKRAWVPWAAMTVLGLAGIVFPTWIYLNVRSFAAQVIGVPIGIGLGVWLNGVGHLLVTGVSVMQISRLLWVEPATTKRKT